MANGNWIVSGKQMVDVTNLTAAEEIKGWMTLQQVADGFGINPTDLYAMAAIPEGVPMSTALKDLEGVLDGFEITVLRDAVTGYLGNGQIGAVIPAMDVTVATEPAATPASTPTPQPSPTSDAAATATAPTHVPQGSGEGDGTGPTPLPPGTVLDASQIKGKHTLSDIAEQAQVPLDQLFVLLKLSDEQDPAATVRDLVDAGLVDEVDAVRSAVLELQSP